MRAIGLFLRRPRAGAGLDQRARLPGGAAARTWSRRCAARADVAEAELVGLAPAAALEGFPDDVPLRGLRPGAAPDRARVALARVESARDGADQEEAQAKAPRHPGRDDRARRAHRAGRARARTAKQIARERRAERLRPAAHLARRAQPRRRSPRSCSACWSSTSCSPAGREAVLLTRLRLPGLHPARLRHRPLAIYRFTRSAARPRAAAAVASPAHGRAHVHRRAGAGELLTCSAATAPIRRADRRPRRGGADKLLGAIEELGRRARRRSCSPTRTSTTSARSRRWREATGAEVWVPRDREARCSPTS